MNHQETGSTLDRFTGWLVDASMSNPLVVVLLFIASVLGGIVVMPWEVEGVPHEPVDVDAIPEIGENIQIVFTHWKGRSPRDVEDQITYPLTSTLLGVPKVKEIRSQSMFGMSFVFVAFEDGTDFYWSRSRILEKLESLPADTLPEGVSPSLGPDATALGQIFWYTLEGRDREGNATGGWSQEELRSIQDWIVRYELMASDGVAEVASIGGYEKEYQVNVDPDALRSYDIPLHKVYRAISESNLDVGADTTEINRVEYIIRGKGYIQDLEDIRKTVIEERGDGSPIFVEHVANVRTGPATRRGALTRGGIPSVGGVVVARHGANSLEVIQNTREAMDRVAGAMPRKILVDDGVSEQHVRRWAEERDIDPYKQGEINHDGFLEWKRLNPDRSFPEWVTVSQVEIVPFYDRSNLIRETLHTLTNALSYQLFITVVVVLLLMMHLGSAVLISSMLPASILMTFLFMKFWDVGADIIALSGIAIAIGTVVAMGIIICENVLKRLEEAPPNASSRQVVLEGTTEVGGAALTAILTTVVSFLPVFFMVGMPGRLFFPLAFTKTAAMVAAAILAIAILPPMFHLFIAGKGPGKLGRLMYGIAIAISGLLLGWYLSPVAGMVAGLIGIYTASAPHLPEFWERRLQYGTNFIVAALVTVLLTDAWMPLGLSAGFILNLIAVTLVVGGIMLGLFLLIWYFEVLLRITLRYRTIFVLLLFGFVAAGVVIWGTLDEEFRPDLKEGSFLYMPIMSYHGSTSETLEGLKTNDRKIESIPEVEESIGKAGRVRSPLDPAPMGMHETIVHYKPEYRQDENGKILRFQYDYEKEEFLRDENGDLIRDPDGKPFRQWRDHIQSPDDIWEEIVEKADTVGWTRPSKLQPIETRLLMLQTGLRAPMGVKVFGPDIQTTEDAALMLEEQLKKVSAINEETVQADRLIGKPYLEINLDREALSRYGVSIRKAQHVVEVAIGGEKVTTTVEGRERYSVRLQYKRELRDTPESLERVLIPAADGTQVPLRQVADIEYKRGPQMIRGEDARPAVYISFSPDEDVAEIEAVEQARSYLESREGDQFILPAGVSYEFAGEYEQQIRAQKVLSIILPIALFVIVIILYLQHGSLSTTLIVFSGILVTWTGGFVWIWLYGQEWFLNVTVAGFELREILNIHQINLSIAVWVGFLALFGIATDDGVLVATKLDQEFRSRSPGTLYGIMETTVEASLQRVRPRVMLIGVTVLALLPVITSTGKGSDVMIPMALPAFGGMTFGLLNLLVVPVLYAVVEEFDARTNFGRTTAELLSVASLFLIPLLYNEYRTLFFGGAE